MAVPYANCFQLSKVNPKCHLFSSSNGLSTRVSPVYSCLKTPGPTLHLEAKVDPVLDSVKWDDKGLAVAIAQNVDTGAVLMQGFINRDALSHTISSRKATFYSREAQFPGLVRFPIPDEHQSFVGYARGDAIIKSPSIRRHRHTLILHKNEDKVIAAGVVCDACVKVINKPSFYSCRVDGNKLALTTLYSLESTISKRKEEFSEDPDSKPSWTKRLLLDEKLLCSKIREEADELCRTLEENEDQTRTASEMADVLYHAMVLLARKGVKVEDVLQVLRLRFAQSGIDEKKSRKAH